MILIHRSAGTMLGSGIAYPVYKINARMQIPAKEIALACLLNAEAMARKKPFIVNVDPNMNKKKVL